MGIMNAGLLGSAIARLAAKAGKAGIDRLRLTYEEIQGRAYIEGARSELRLGNIARAESLLAVAEERLPAEHTAARAVVLSLQAQSRDQRRWYDQAIELFREAVARFEAAGDAALTPRDHGDFGIALAAIDRLGDARTHLDRAVAAEGAPPEAYRALALVLVRLGKLGRAEDLVAKTLLALPADARLHLARAQILEARESPLAADSYLRAGDLYLADGDPASALAAADHAGSAEALRLRAEALRQLGRHEEAMSAFDEALRADGRNAWLLVRRAATARDLGRPFSADLEQAIQLAPDSADVLRIGGEVLRAAGDLGNAARVAGRALAADPDDGRVVALAATLRWEQGDIDGALAIARAATPEARRRAELLRVHARMYRAVGRPDEALESLESLRVHPDLTPGDAVDYATDLVDLGRPREAVAAIVDYRDVWPDDFELLLTEADLRDRLGESDLALDRARLAVAVRPDDARGHLTHAVALYNRDPEGHADEALGAVARSAELAPNWPDPPWIRARILANRHDADGARAALDRVFELDPEHRPACRLEVELYFDAGDLEEAERRARELVVDPFVAAEDRLLLGRVLLARSQYTDAEAQTTEAIAEDPERDVLAACLRVRAAARFMLDRLTDAEADLQRAVDLLPGDGQARMQQSRVNRYRGDLDAALKHARAAVELTGNDPEARLELATVHFERGSMDEAETIVEDLLRSAPDDLRVQLADARLLAIRDPTAARRELTELAAQHPADVEVASARASLERQQGDYEAVLAALEPIPDDRLPLDLLAVRADARQVLGRLDEALDDARRCLNTAPDMAGALETAGRALLRLGLADEAVEMFEQAVRAHPSNEYMKAQLGESYAQVDRYTEAVDLLDYAAAAYPDDDWVITMLGDKLAEVGLFAAAETLYRRVCERSADDVYAWAGLGWCLENGPARDLRGAEAAYRRTLELEDDDPWNRKSVADILQLLGRRDEAANLFRQARAEALAGPEDRPDLVAWCSFQLGEFDAAARGLYEVTSNRNRVGSDHFDLALVHLCAGRVSRGASQYRRCLSDLDHRHPQRARGLLTVAVNDLDNALVSYPEMAAEPGAAMIRRELTDRLRAVPPPPRIRAVEDAG
jgi:tetratricopeptide (TPR) repeat protein